MIIGFLKENDEFETRSMVLPEHVSNLGKMGFKILVEQNYAEQLNIKDNLYSDVGAEIMRNVEQRSMTSEEVIRLHGEEFIRRVHFPVKPF